MLERLTLRNFNRFTPSAPGVAEGASWQLVPAPHRSPCYVVGEIPPAAEVERVLGDDHAGRLGDANPEEPMLTGVDDARFRAIPLIALEGLATKKLDLDVLTVNAPAGPVVGGEPPPPPYGATK